MDHQAVQRLASFSRGEEGGNPAGVLLTSELPDAGQMQAIAAEVGYSETAFAAPRGDAWRVRYFAPELEVPFCGHATIALGAALAMAKGDGTFPLILNEAEITVRGWQEGGTYHAALQSPPTSSHAADAGLASRALALFGLSSDDLDPRIPVALANGGANHLVIALRDRGRLATIEYDFEAGRELMTGADLITINLVHAESEQLFHSRNPFAAGGVYEDPATGAAAAALAGYLRDLQWPHGGSFVIRQGEDMQVPSRIEVSLSDDPGSSVEVRGAVRQIT